MKKIVLFILAIVTLSSCEDVFGDFLDKAPGAEITEEEVFSNWIRTGYYHNDIYNYLRTGKDWISSRSGERREGYSTDGSWLDSGSDIGISSRDTDGSRTSFNVGNYFDAGGAVEIIYTWNDYFEAIRKCNKFLERADGVPLAADETPQGREEELTRLKAEARALRAYFYWELVIRYGPLPIITSSLDPYDENVAKLPRPGTIDSITDFILSELQASYSNLYNDRTMTNAWFGRFSQGVNMALQVRILLYLASPQYNTSNDAAKWTAARDKALEFINTWGHESSNPMYYLYNPSGNAPGVNYQLAINRRAFDGNMEAIFFRNSTASDWWAADSPVSYGGRGGLCPSQNLIDMYDMVDGTAPFASYDETGAPVYNAAGIPAINEVSGYSDQNPYANRDPRLSMTVLYNGSIWWNEPVDTYVGGKDNPLGSPYATRTSYYNKKYHDDSQTHYLMGGTMYRNWQFIRYAEILLSYAEAQNELDATPSDAVYETLQSIRDRAGITGDLNERVMTKSEMRNFIRKERTVELAFEEHRWWDVRRWKVAEAALGRPVYGMNIVKSGDNLTFTREKVQDRFFQTKMYLYPIPEQQLWITGMQNNPGW